jgi:hypothetical protein
VGRPRLRALALSSVVALACGQGGPSDRVAEGPWGGEHLAVLVGPTGATVGFDCAHGAITVPLRLDPDGRFTLPGYYVRDVGPTEDPENRQPATYSGSSDGQRLTLSFVVIDSGVADGPFTAFLGAAAQLQQCR